MKKNDWPAFPASIEQLEKCLDGMSIRDWFAGKALQGQLACESEGFIVGDAKDVAMRSYEFADAMLAARGRER